MVHHNVRDVALDFAISEEHASILPGLMHLDDSRVLKLIENCYFTFKFIRFTDFGVLQEFDCYFFCGVNLATEEHFGRHALSKLPDDIVLAIEDRVEVALLPLRQLQRLFSTNLRDLVLEHFVMCIV